MIPLFRKKEVWIYLRFNFLSESLSLYIAYSLHFVSPSFFLLPLQNVMTIYIKHWAFVVSETEFTPTRNKVSENVSAKFNWVWMSCWKVGFQCKHYLHNLILSVFNMLWITFWSKILFYNISWLHVIRTVLSHIYTTNKK